MRKWIICLISIAMLFLCGCSDFATATDTNTLLYRYILDSLGLKQSDSDVNVVVVNPNSSCLYCVNNLFKLGKKEKFLIITDIKTSRMFKYDGCNLLVDTNEYIFDYLPPPNIENKLIIIRDKQIRRIYSIYPNNLDSIQFYIEHE